MTAREHTTPLPASKAALLARPGHTGIDPRGPRFGAGITSVLLLVTIGLSLGTAATAPPNVAGRATQPGFILLAIITVLFAWGAFAGVQKHPYGRLFAAVVRPRLAAPTHLEDPTPPTFSQGVGFIVSIAGVALHLAGVPFGLVIPAALAFVAAFLNSVFDYCFGCQIYLLLVRARILARAPTSVS
ncbi:DUF4395 domain-containing protein [Parafrigoribacterium humi]|jgi:hypothetical protein|uniref:DUF4395 domain-containing protein n=1 Tax=Parafrigoribacterium humi TaxID=3144664 RepID=UPI0032EB03F2